MKRRWILIGIFVMGIILIPVLYNVIVIRSRIYYIIDYNVNLSSREEIIHKVENFNYPAYLSYNYFYNNLELVEGFKSYVDRDLILFLKSRIESDTGFKWWPSYKHYFSYSFVAEIHSTLYLMYNNNTIFSVKDHFNDSLILVEDYVWSEIAWYLNFIQIPYVYDDNSTVILSDCIFVEISLEYEWLCGYICETSYSLKQYLVLSENLDVVLIFIHYYYFRD